MGWGELEDALVAWVRAGTGLADSKVMLARQKNPRMSRPYALVSIEGFDSLGACDEVRRSQNLGSQWQPDADYEVGDRVFNGANADTYDCSQAGHSDAEGTGPSGNGTGIEDGTATWDYANGTEIAETVTGQRECRVLVEVFADTAIGTGCAMALASKVATAAGLSSVTFQFEQAGASIFDIGRAVAVPEVFEDSLENRAQLAARLYTTDSLTEYAGYIAAAEIQQVDEDGNEVPPVLIVP